MSTPPASIAATHRVAATLHEALDTDLHLYTTIGVSPDGTPWIDIQIPTTAADADERRDLVTAAAALLITRLDTSVYPPDVTTWGSVGTRGTWDGHPTVVWTALTRAEARAAGLATCIECGHGDHDPEQICLAAMVTEEGDHRACECGMVTTEPAVYIHDLDREELDNRAWENYRDDARDCAADTEVDA